MYTFLLAYYIVIIFQLLLANYCLQFIYNLHNYCSLRQL